MDATLTNKIILENFILELQKLNPKYNVVNKKDSILMKILSKILFFNNKFMTSYITTIGNTVYLADNNFYERDIYIANPLGSLAHEFRHTRDAAKYGPLYYLGYLSPVIFSLLIIPFCFVLGWWALLFLLFLLPIPSLGRMIIELRGYTMTLFVYHYFAVKDNKEDIKGLLMEAAQSIESRNFHSSSYYFMWPFDMMNLFEKKVNEIINCDILLDDGIFNEVKSALDAVFIVK